MHAIPPRHLHHGASFVSALDKTNIMIIIDIQSLTIFYQKDIPTASLKGVYTDFYHRLVEAVSDEHTCQSLLTQLSSFTLISDDKIAQLSSSKVTGNSLLKILGLEEDPHLLVPLVSAMSRVEQMQTLAEKMSAMLNQGAKKIKKDFYRDRKYVG